MVFVSFDEMSLKLATCELYFLIFLFFSLFLLALVCLRFSMSRGPGRKGSFLESRREREREKGEVRFRWCGDELERARVRETSGLG